MLIDDSPDVPSVVAERQGIRFSDADIWQRLRRGLVEADLAPENDFPWPVAGFDECPYPGLEPFEAHHAGVYFGRDKEILELREQLNQMTDKPDPERIRSYLAWPLYRSLKAADRAALRSVAKIIEVPPPVDLNIDAKTPIAPDTATGRRIWSRCLTAMRHRMNAETDARIFLGGRLTGFKGKYPGLVEESHLAITAGKPVYLLGGFGGCTAAIIEALAGNTPDSPADYQSLIDD